MEASRYWMLMTSKYGSKYLILLKQNNYRENIKRKKSQIGDSTHIRFSFVTLKGPDQAQRHFKSLGHHSRLYLKLFSPERNIVRHRYTLPLNNNRELYMGNLILLLQYDLLILVTLKKYMVIYRYCFCLFLSPQQCVYSLGNN